MLTLFVLLVLSMGIGYYLGKRSVEGEPFSEGYAEGLNYGLLSLPKFIDNACYKFNLHNTHSIKEIHQVDRLNEVINITLHFSPKRGEK